MDPFVPVAGYPNYKINRSGTIVGPMGKALKPRIIPGGYIQAILYRDLTRSAKLVHRLVLETFVGPCPDGMECCHADGDVTNNSLDNLRWDTHQANIDERVSARPTCRRDHPWGPFGTNGQGKRARRCQLCRRIDYQEKMAARRAS